MLAEIRCSEFKDGGIERPPVVFSDSLNVILGSSDGSNSIGKSTFLLIVDFAFGGNSYAKDTDILENVGPHSIEFRFRFHDTDYRFSRSPIEPGTVWKCNDDYSRVEAITLADFTGWLSMRYGMVGLGGTFRGMSSNFFRVYGKDNCDMHKPLSSHPQEPKKEGISRLIELFDKYGAIDHAQKLLNDAKKAKKTFSDSLSRNFIASARNKTEVRANTKRIEELNEEMEEIELLEHDNASELDPLVAEQLAEMKHELSLLRRRRTRLRSQLAMLDADEDLGKFKASKDFEKLLEFFPDANVKKLKEIESFHSGLTAALKSERTEQRQNIEESLGELDECIDATISEIGSIGSTSNLTESVLKRYSNLALEKTRLEQANSSYSKKSDLADTVRSLTDQRDSLIGAALSETQSEINDRLVALNRYVCGEGVSVPCLSIPGPNSYDFSIANDSGTGSQARAMALLDLAVLELTPLPAISLDTITSKHISDGRMIKILELYRQQSKQVFVTFDKAESYSDGALPQILDGCVVLRLSQGHELFGRSWASGTSSE